MSVAYGPEYYTVELYQPIHVSIPLIAYESPFTIARKAASELVAAPNNYSACPNDVGIWEHLSHACLVRMKNG